MASHALCGLAGSSERRAYFIPIRFETTETGVFEEHRPNKKNKMNDMRSFPDPARTNVL